MQKVASYQVSLKIFLKNEKGEVLILKTPEKSSFHGRYDFPGGRIDSDEFYIDLLDILKREVEEELGTIQYRTFSKPVAVARHRSIPASSQGDIFFTFWEGEMLSGNIRISHEHCGYMWVDLSQISLEEHFESGILEAVKIYLGRK